jgi:hypothetical protein
MPDPQIPQITRILNELVAARERSANLICVIREICGFLLTRLLRSSRLALFAGQMQNDVRLGNAAD